MISTFVIFLVALALFFDFINGFNDAANAIATVVVTRVMTPMAAVLMSASANFVGAFFFSVAVANTIGNGIIDTSIVTKYVIFAALLGAICWGIITWYFGIPSSSSHALVGGLVGAGFAASGPGVINFIGLATIAAFIVIAPLLGVIGGIIFTGVVFNAVKEQPLVRINYLFRKLQIISALFFSIGHGVNDAQKTMGIISVLLLSEKLIDHFYVPTWVKLACYAMISLGTALGGWRIVKSMGEKITKLQPIDGFCASTPSAIVLITTAHFGIPISTTHVVSGSLMGVGMVKNIARVGWKTVRSFVVAWVLTIPAAATVAMISYRAIMLLRPILMF